MLSCQFPSDTKIHAAQTISAGSIFQKVNLTPNCIWRDGCAEVMTENVEVSGAIPFHPGSLKLTRLKILKASPRNWTLNLSPTKKFFAMAKSSWLKLGPRTSLVPAVPKV